MAILRRYENELFSLEVMDKNPFDFGIGLGNGFCVEFSNLEDGYVNIHFTPMDIRGKYDNGGGDQSQFQKNLHKRDLYIAWLSFSRYYKNHEKTKFLCGGQMPVRAETNETFLNFLCNKMGFTRTRHKLMCESTMERCFGSDMEREVNRLLFNLDHRYPEVRNYALAKSS